MLGIHRIRQVSHIVIDEVHERSCDNDLLLSVCRQLLKRRRVKVILMSATLSVDALTVRQQRRCFGPFLTHFSELQWFARLFPPSPPPRSVNYKDSVSLTYCSAQPYATPHACLV